MNDERLPRKISWWERRTRIEKCLLVISVFFFIVIIYMASNLLMAFPSSEELKREVCMTEKCIQDSASLSQMIDKKVDPCDDFYKFACGNFVKNRIIPEDRSIVSTFSLTGDKVTAALRNIFEEPLQEDSPSYLKLVKTYYNTCMNTSRIEKEGLAFMKREFKELGGWPVIDPYWNERNFDWQDLFFKITKKGFRRTIFINMYVGLGQINTTSRIFKITQPCYAYETYKKGLNDTVVKALYAYLVDLAVAFGADRENAVLDMKDVIDFEIEYANLFVPYEERKNRTLYNNPMTIRELQKKYPNTPWLKLINNYLSPIEMLTSNDVINVDIPLYIERVDKFLPKIRKRTLANYMFMGLVRDSAYFLTEEIRKIRMNLFKAAYGIQSDSPRWKNCVSDVTRFNVAVSVLHSKNFFHSTTKRKVEELVYDIKSSFIDTLHNILWMDRKTKKHALAKIEKMNSVIGFPNEILDNEKVETHYEGLELDPKASYLELNYEIYKFRHLKHIHKLRQPIKKPDWENQAYSYAVNAFYDSQENAIELPAAVLQELFFAPDRPQYLNYGAIGSIIGHEITHGFDDTGRQYDKDGNLVDWWEPETNKTFSKRSQCFVDQYSNFTVPEIEMNVNGLKTLGENIADNGGIKIAYRGYLKWLERHKSEPELMLPGLPYTPKQLFWISAAMKFCAKYKKEYLKKMVTSSSHAPNSFRVLVSFMNSDDFGKDFNCPLGSKMNPEHKCKVW